MNAAISLILGAVLIAKIGELVRRLRRGQFSRMVVEPKIPTNAGR